MRMLIMNIAELFKKNLVLVPVDSICVSSGRSQALNILLDLTDTINANQSKLVNLQERFKSC